MQQADWEHNLLLALLAQYDGGLQIDQVATWGPPPLGTRLTWDQVPP